MLVYNQVLEVIYLRSRLRIEQLKRYLVQKELENKQKNVVDEDEE